MTILEHNCESNVFFINLIIIKFVRIYIEVKYYLYLLVLSLLFNVHTLSSVYCEIHVI